MTTTLLGVDDSKTMRKVIEITFAGEDFKTVLAENADDAMSKLHAERPNVVLVDAALEGTNGYELCQRLKAAAPGVGVVLLASKQQPYDRNRGVQVGADEFVDKPFDTQQLIDKVNALLRRLAAGAAAPAAQPVAAAAHAFGGGAQPMAARPATVEASVRQRTQTLAYGQTNPLAGAGPVAPVIPPPVAPSASPVAAVPPRPMPVPQSSPMAAPPKPAPVAPIAAQPAPMAASPSPPAVAPSPAAPRAAAISAGNGAEFTQKLAALGLSAEQVSAVLALSREVVEKVVWEVVPTLAETMIKEEIKRLTAD